MLSYSGGAWQRCGGHPAAAAAAAVEAVEAVEAAAPAAAPAAAGGGVRYAAAIQGRYISHLGAGRGGRDGTGERYAT